MSVRAHSTVAPGMPHGLRRMYHLEDAGYPRILMDMKHRSLRDAKIALDGASNALLRLLLPSFDVTRFEVALRRSLVPLNKRECARLFKSIAVGDDLELPLDFRFKDGLEIWYLENSGNTRPPRGRAHAALLAFATTVTLHSFFTYGVNRPGWRRMIAVWYSAMQMGEVQARAAGISFVACAHATSIALARTERLDRSMWEMVGRYTQVAQHLLCAHGAVETEPSINALLMRGRTQGELEFLSDDECAWVEYFCQEAGSKKLQRKS